MDRFLVIPSASRASLLFSPSSRLPRSSRTPVSALRAFSGLRAPLAKWSRRGLAAVAQVGAPIGLDELRLEHRVGTPTLPEPVSYIRGILGADLNVMIGVREGANAKGTLQLFDECGRPVGYAKVGWTDLTAEFVRTETATLNQMDGSGGPVRTPRVVCSGQVAMQPFVVTEPLPSDVRRITDVADLGISHFAAVAPFRRLDSVRSTSHFVRMCQRLEEHRVRFSALVDHARSLASRLRDADELLPVAARWHGDLVPWNTALEGTGQVWVFDWETCEEDAVGGLDAVHWELHASARPGRLRLSRCLPTALAQSRATTTALGFGPRTLPLLGGLYALSIAERHIGLAAVNGGWQRNRVQPDEVADLLNVGKQLLDLDAL